MPSPLPLPIVPNALQPGRRRKYRQRGITLLVVMVLVMLSMLLVFWASRTSLFNQILTGNDADYQRAFAAAQALLQDAELDISGKRADGTACSGGTCRPGNVKQIPREDKDVLNLIDDLKTANNGLIPCQDALCVKNVKRQDIWNNTNQIDGITREQMMRAGIAARYGQYTGAKADAGGNQLLQITDPARPLEGGWYWIEVMPYVSDAGKASLIAGGSNLIPLSLSSNVLYRITAVAYGLKRISRGNQDEPATTVVLQEIFVREKLRD